jgi:tripartite-type tricarboxylate transporter receptor subunit TctC
MKVVRPMRAALWIACLAAFVAVAAPALAQPGAAPFPIGKPVSMYLGFEPGGGNDQIMRLIARNIGRHLPGSPNVIPRNMPGAGGRRLAGHMYNSAPRDGTELPSAPISAAWSAIRARRR